MMDQCRRDVTRAGREATGCCALRTVLRAPRLFSCSVPALRPRSPDDTLSLILLLSYKKSFVFFCHFSRQFQHLSFLYFVFVCLHRPMWVYL